MQSVWAESGKFKSHDRLGDANTDVLVIGGGIAGILIAKLLKESGTDAILIEKNKIAGGVTKNTTAKITCQHDLIYDRIYKNFGHEATEKYAAANLQALNKYREIIARENIDCAFENISTFLYTKENEQKLIDEQHAMQGLGFQSALVAQTELPFPIQAALELKDQAQFNPLMFLSELTTDLKIYEDTQALSIFGNEVTTNNGKIKAKKIIVATHFPFINNPGYYFMRQHQERSYVMALDNATIKNAYLGIDDEYYSLRSYGDKILFGGMGHRTGESPQDCYDRLQAAAKSCYPNSQINCMWSAQDCMTHDGIPYIGNYATSLDHVYVATGFNKWGMTSSMVSAIILTDLINEKQNEFADLFSPSRMNFLASAKNLVVDGLETISGLANRLELPNEKLLEVEVSKGGIVMHGDEKIGIYRQSENVFHAIKTKCSHLGCSLSWNSEELTWECKCHGSRFDFLGRVLNNPAQKGLAYEKLSLQQNDEEIL